jgi:hypothetical protein
MHVDIDPISKKGCVHHFDAEAGAMLPFLKKKCRCRSSSACLYASRLQATCSNVIAWTQDVKRGVHVIMIRKAACHVISRSRRCTGSWRKRRNTLILPCYCYQMQHRRLRPNRELYMCVYGIWTPTPLAGSFQVLWFHWTESPSYPSSRWHRVVMRAGIPSVRSFPFHRSSSQ